MIPNIRRLQRRLKRRLKWRIEDRLWHLRLKLVYHLVGDRSFVANVDVVGALYLTRITFNIPLMRNVWVFDNEEIREQERSDET